LQATNVLELGKLKNQISALQKWKTHFYWEEMKIGLHGVPRHPKATRVSDMASFRQTIQRSGPNQAHLT
jgi:hypothetical protein